MSHESHKQTSHSEQLPPKEITNRFNQLEAGDKILINNHNLTYEVIDTDTYSVIAEDPKGNNVTFSQNLQTGGWSLSEDIFHIESCGEGEDPITQD